MVKLYFIRHGESLANQKDVFIGQYDFDLTEKGRKQAEMVADYLKDVKVDAIYSSDLLRAYHTAEATANLLNLPIIKDKGLREIDGGLWEDTPFSQLKEKFYDSFLAYTTSNMFSARIDGGESVRELTDRFYSSVKKIADSNENKTIFIFAHATPIRCFSAFIEGKDDERVNEVPWPNNCSVTEVDYLDGKFKLVRYGYDEFMGGIKTSLPKKF